MRGVKKLRCFAYESNIKPGARYSLLNDKKLDNNVYSFFLASFNSQITLYKR